MGPAAKWLHRRSTSTSTSGRNCGDVFTAETAEGAEMKRVAQDGLRRLVNELPEGSLRAPRAPR